MQIPLAQAVNTAVFWNLFIALHTAEFNDFSKVYSHHCYLKSVLLLVFVFGGTGVWTQSGPHTIARQVLYHLIHSTSPLVLFLFFCDRVSLCSPSWPWTHNPLGSASCYWDYRHVLPWPVEYVNKFFFLLWVWSLNPGLHICKADSLPPEPHLQSILLWLFWR
jgi:hypothetical protein